MRAAERALDRGGYEALSIRELSREVGVSDTAFRRHFRDKQALLETLAAEGFRRLGQVLRLAAADPAASFDDRLARIGLACIGFGATAGTFVELMRASTRRPNMAPELLAECERMISLLRATVVEGQAAGEVVEGDPLHLALVAFAAMEGMFAVAASEIIQLEDLAPQTMAVLVFGFRPRR